MPAAKKYKTYSTQWPGSRACRTPLVFGGPAKPDTLIWGRLDSNVRIGPARMALSYTQKDRAPNLISGQRELSPTDR